MLKGIKHPDVTVKLTGKDGNVFAIIGNVSRALKKAGYAKSATEFTNAAMQSPSYDAVLQLCMATVEVK